MYDAVDFNTLQGLVLENILIDRSGDEVLYFVTDGGIFKMYHEQDCCESVGIEDVVGDLRDLVGEKILTAEESSNAGTDEESGGESSTWTFYRLGTSKGDVVIRWFGQSNGYYSEGVSVYRHEGATPKSAVEFVWKE
jgi:hypothetical protein